MNLTSKNENYVSPKADRGLFKNPVVKYTSGSIDVENQRLTINFALRYDDSGETRTLERISMQFNVTGQDMLITNDTGDSVEILEHLNAGGIYDPAKIIAWGMPSFDRVQDYFELESVWTGLTFKEQPLKQLAIDWFMNTLKVEGCLIKEKFILEE